MKVPETLANAFGTPFEELISRFAADEGLLPEPAAIHSNRFLSRSVIPHIQKLSKTFNRIDEPQSTSLDPYWKESSNPTNLRLAYFLYFMPSNLFRVASVWAELARLGFRWPEESRQLKAIELGAGPASGACGLAAGERYASVGLPKAGNWALLEQDRAMLDLGSKWAAKYFENSDLGEWGIRTFHRKLDFKKGSLLPPSAPRFNLWLMSYFLNELEESPETIAQVLLKTWEKHLEMEGIAILVEPALKLQSRKLLEIRKHLIQASAEKRYSWMKILLPCLGHQACGALASEDDWCHEEVTWWRPPYFKLIDQMAELDRKSLPFSYLVIAKSHRQREELLPALQSFKKTHRLVSPAHSEGKEREFFVCGADGKKRARYRPEGEEDPARAIGRGDILLDAEIRGDRNSSRVEQIRKLL